MTMLRSVGQRKVLNLTMVLNSWKLPLTTLISDYALLGLTNEDQEHCQG